ncbi:MAG: hypothetical protein ACOVNV_12340, partial [Pirellulaceae bacterium]
MGIKAILAVRVAAGTSGTASDRLVLREAAAGSRSFVRLSGKRGVTMIEGEVWESEEPGIVRGVCLPAS